MYSQMHPQVRPPQLSSLSRQVPCAHVRRTAPRRGGSWAALNGVRVRRVSCVSVPECTEVSYAQLPAAERFSSSSIWTTLRLAGVLRPPRCQNCAAHWRTASAEVGYGWMVPARLLRPMLCCVRCKEGGAVRGRLEFLVARGGTQAPPLPRAEGAAFTKRRVRAYELPACKW